MASDFSNIGFDVNSSKDIYDMLVNNQAKLKVYSCGDRQYAILRLDKFSWLFFYGDENGLNGEGCELAFLNPYLQEVEFEKWVNMSEYGANGLIQIFCEGGAADFPLNVVIPDACKYRNKKMKDSLSLSMTLFTQELSVYESFEAYKNAQGDGPCLDGCIPCGTFAPPGREQGFVPSATAIMSGTVLHAQKLVNSYTGNEFWNVVFDCAGYEFVLVADPEFAPDGIKEGDFIHGYFWISGLLMNDSTEE